MLQNLDESPAIQNAEAVVLSEHVDYWNHDGWRDPYSSAFFTQRQRAYAARFRLDDVYTPEMVVDGRTQFVGSDSQRARDAIASAASEPKILVHISPVTLEGRILKFRVDTEGSLTPATRQAEVYVALAYERATSQVSAGENSGRQLTHVAVAREFTKVGIVPPTGSFSKEVRLKMSDDLRPGNIRLIAYLQEPGQGIVLGAAMEHVAQTNASR